MKQWKIPVTWEVFSIITVEADTIEDAMEIARDDIGEIPLPTESYYVDGSWRLSIDDDDVVRRCYNDNQPDDAPPEPDWCYECTGYGDDYSVDDDGNLVCNCDTCPFTSSNGGSL